MADESQRTDQQEAQAQPNLGEQQQEQAQAQQQAPAQPEQPKADEAAQKMSPDEFREKLHKGEIDTSRTDVEEYINELVDFDTSKEQAEQQQQPQQAPPPQKEQQAQAQEQVPEPVKYKDFKEFLSAARKETGDDIKNAHDLIQRAKNKKEQLAAVQSALQRWKNDATTTKSQVDDLQRTIKTLQEQVKSYEEQSKAASQQQQPQQQSQQQQSQPEPEVPEPDWNEASPEERAEYWKKVRERDQRESERKAKELEKQFEERINKIEASQTEKEKKWQQKAEEDRKKEAQARAHEEVVAAADDFLRQHSEFQFGDNKTVAEKEQEYIGFMKDLDYLAQQDPKYHGRNLPDEYLKGNKDVEELVAARGLTPPEGLKQFSILAELVQLANQHNFYVNRMRDSNGNEIPNTGRPDFAKALAIKKETDGVSLAELQDARVKGAKETLEVVQQRQAAPPNISASEASATKEKPAVTHEQVMGQIQEIQKRLSTAPPDQRQALMKQLDEQMAAIGMAPTGTPQQ